MTKLTIRLFFLLILALAAGALVDHFFFKPRRSLAAGKEAKKNCLRFWRPNGKFVINRMGPAPGHRGAGKNCFMIDVAFQEEDAYLDLALPIKQIPAEGGLKFSGKILIAEPSQGAEANLGLSLSLTPCLPLYEFGKDMLPWIQATDQKWLEVNGDLDALVKPQVEKVLPVLNPGDVKPENAGVNINRLALYLRPRAGAGESRLVVYVDDPRINGKPIDAAEYERIVAGRWAPIKAKTDSRLVEWRKKMAVMSAEVLAAANLSPAGEELRNKIRGQFYGQHRSINEIEWAGFLMPAKQAQIESTFKHIASEINKMKSLGK